MDRGDAHDDAVRTTLDAIRNLKQTGVSPDIEQKLDEVTRALAAEPSASGERRFGAFAGRFKIGPEFFEPLSEEELRAWGEI